MDQVDAQILARVATLFGTMDPVPADLVERLQFAISLDALEFELAVLQLSSGEVLTNRADAARSVQSMTFASGHSPPRSRSVPTARTGFGWTVGSRPAAGPLVELHQGADHRETEADEDGRFVFADVRHGLTRFMVRPVGMAADDRPVVTPAVEI